MQRNKVVLSELLNSDQFDEDVKKTLEEQGLESRQLSRWILTYQSINDKCVASCVEALIGAYLVECGRKGAALFMSWVGFELQPQNDRQGKIGASVRYQDSYAHNSSNSRQTLFGADLDPHQFIQPSQPSMNQYEDVFRNLYERKRYANFERAIGYTFKNRNLLLQAFTHETYSRKRCYER